MRKCAICEVLFIYFLFLKKRRRRLKRGRFEKRFDLEGDKQQGSCGLEAGRGNAAGPVNYTSFALHSPFESRSGEAQASVQ